MKSFEDELVSLLPTLPAFVYRLGVSTSDRIDDLVQTVTLIALENQQKFESRSTMKSWLYVILRNCVYSEFRRNRRTVPTDPTSMQFDRPVGERQTNVVTLHQVRDAIEQLPQHHRDALCEVAVSGEAYEDAADKLGIPVNTVKTHVRRARMKLSALK